MGHIVQRLVRNAIMQAVNQVIQKKTQQEAAKFGNEWKGSFHCLVSGYYSGMTVKYLMLPFAVFYILCAIGSGIAGGLTYRYLVPCDRSGVPGYAQLWNENDACDHLLGQWYGIL